MPASQEKTRTPRGCTTIPKPLVRAANRVFGGDLWCWAPVETAGEWRLVCALANVGGGWCVTDRVFRDAAAACGAAERYNAPLGIDRNTMERIRLSAAATSPTDIRFQLPRAFEYQADVFQGLLREGGADIGHPPAGDPPPFPMEIPLNVREKAEKALIGCYWAWTTTQAFNGHALCAIAANRAGVYVSDEYLPSRGFAIAIADEHNAYRGLNRAQAAQVLGTGLFSCDSIQTHVKELLQSSRLAYTVD